MPSRKKAKGKARKAAKAKEESQAVEMAANQRENESIETKMQRLMINAASSNICRHDCLHLSDSEAKIYVEFIQAFIAVFHSKDHVVGGLLAAQEATIDEYADVYNSKLDKIIAMLLSYGTQMILNGNNRHAQLHAMLAFHFEEIMAMCLHGTIAKGTKDPINWLKICELYDADDHTLVSYYRKRTPCSCLDKKYREVKSVKKMGRCFNPNCSHPGGMVERSKMFSCTRCGKANYCSVECQRADWKEHKMYCNKTAERAQY